MKTILGIALALLLGLADPVIAGDMAVTNAWARATSPNTTVGIAFVTLAASTADTLVTASTPAAAKVEFHRHVHQDGLMKMQQQPTVEVAAGQPLEFNPGGLHLMLIGLKEQLKPGRSFPLTLTFAKAGAVTVTVAVEGPGAMAPTMMMDHSMHDQHMADPAYKAMHEEHMKDPAHKAMHDQMHGTGK
ncbi:MAG: copper chaperone PCu(A)C [Magnetospirillum sp.]|nr:MAG: copper chaperone PCu(A)C [Magnetospirillum sp.]